MGEVLRPDVVLQLPARKDSLLAEPGLLITELCVSGPQPADSHESPHLFSK